MKNAGADHVQREDAGLAGSSSALFQHGLDALEDGFSLWDANLNLIFCNKRFVTLTLPAGAGRPAAGSTFESLVSMALASPVYDMPEGESVSEFAERVVRWVKSPSDPIEIKRPDGRALVLTAAAVNEGGRVVIARDATGQQNAEAQARAMLHEAIDSVSFDVALVDDDNRLVFANRKFREIGDPKGNVLTSGHTMRAIHGDAVDTGLFPLPPGMDKEDLLDLLDDLIHKSARGFPVPNNHGSDILGSIYETTLGGRLLTLEDLSEQRRIERRLAAAMEHLPVGIAIEDGNGRIVHCNDMFTNLHGRPAGELLSRSFEERMSLIHGAIAEVDGKPLAGTAPAARAPSGRVAHA